jgi:hypothetical protein
MQGVWEEKLLIMLICAVGGLRGFNFLVRFMVFVDCLVISLGGWRTAVSRMAAPRGPDPYHRWYPFGIMLTTSSVDTLGCKFLDFAFINTS